MRFCLNGIGKHEKPDASTATSSHPKTQSLGGDPKEDRAAFVELATRLGRRSTSADARRVRHESAAEWIREAQTERDNDGAVIGVVVAKRKGTTAPGQQWCLMTVDDLIHLLKEKA